MTTENFTPPRAATLHLGGNAYAHSDLAPLVRELTPNIQRHPENPRRGDHEAIVESIRINGVYSPVKIQVSTGYILAGNHTFDAITDQGGTHMPWVWLDVDDHEARRIMLADNRTAELGGYDQALLVEQIRAAQAADTLAGTGYTPDDLSELERALEAARPPLSDPEDVPPPPATPITREGDIWHLGPHRVMCGDALSDLPLDTLLNGEQPDLIYTDPPYGINIVNRPSAGQGKVGGSKPVTIQGKVGAAVGSATRFNDQGKGGGNNIVRTKWYAPVIGDDTTETATRAVNVCLTRWPKAEQVWWGGNHYAGDAHLPNSACWLIWDKQTTGNWADAELAWTNHRGSVRMFTHRWNGLLRDSERGSTARVHPTQKPVALAVWCYQQMLGAKIEGAIILDIFGGSGSALIAAEQVGARARIMELSPAYVDVICRRYQNHTGTLPVRDGITVDFNAGDLGGTK